MEIAKTEWVKRKKTTQTDQPILMSAVFDDVYFSLDDGWAETDYVFIQGNDLEAKMKAAIASDQDIVIGELGFGTGLNFLVVVNLWQRLKAKNMSSASGLHFVSLEGFPLNVESFVLSHQQFQQNYPQCMMASKRMIDLYEDVMPNDGDDARECVKLQFDETIKLTICFAAADTYLSLLIKYDIPKINAWFLDGFAPAKNPDMWSATLMQNLASYSSPNASFATFTAAANVRKHLTQAGFQVEKINGFGRKRNMLIGAIGAGCDDN